MANDRKPMISAERVAELAPDDMVSLAIDWHGGQSSALYLLASTGAIWSWDHLYRLSLESGWSATAADSYDSGDPGFGDGDRLRELEAWADALLAANPYAPGGILADTVPDPGGYNLLALTDDSDLLCERCATDPDNPCHPADDAYGADGWGIAGWIADGETESETDYPCAHCGRIILKGYAEGAES